MGEKRGVISIKSINKNAVMCLRLERQCLFKKANREGYEKLFRLMQPVQPVYWCCPGEPPRLVHRTDIDDNEFNFRQRADRRIIKGRFQNGTIAYIYTDELELYAGAYRKKIASLSLAERLIYELLEREGPLTIQIIKEMTELLVKQITPVLHKLQEAFLVYEDQVDNEWDRAWYIFSSEFLNVDLGRYSEIEAIKEIVMKFLYLNVFADIDMIKSYYRLPLKYIKEAVLQLEKENKIKKVNIEDKTGFVKTEDIQAIGSLNECSPVKSVFVFHRNDFLVKSNEHWLKQKFHSQEHEILFYILIDGEFKGIILGKFRNGPFDIEDIELDLPMDEKLVRKDEIIKAVYEINDPEKSPVKKYCGKQL